MFHLLSVFPIKGTYLVSVGTFIVVHVLL
eukprot:SAG11_NODE_33952_length_274_cov_1.171429_1_plen_28_part_10